jgi:putative hydroxymethylpyrimidine transport system permease protein
MPVMRLGIIFGSLGLGLTIWQLAVTLTGVPRFILPGPALVLSTIWKSRALLAEHALITISEVMIGLALGIFLGALSAIGLASSKVANAMLRPILVFSQAIPVFALAPLLTLWLGYGLWSKIVMALLIIYFPVTSAFFDGLMRTPRDWLDLAHVMRATPLQIMWRVRIPAALPGLASGVRLAAVYAPIGAIIGEWVGASKGLGYLMLLANGRAKIDLMFAALIVLAIFTLLLHALVDYGCRRGLAAHRG